jgi:hypothetical protein
MTRLVRGELVKLRTTRTAVGFAAAAVLLVVATVLVVALATDARTVADKRDAINFGGWLSIIVLVYGVVGATGEYRHRTQAPALLIAPARVRLVLARAAAYAAGGAAFGVLLLVVTFGLGLPLMAAEPGPGLAASDLWHVGAGGVLTAVLCAAIGVGIGTLVGNQVAAVVGSLVWFFIVEPLVALPSEGASKFTIGQTSTALSGGTTGEVLGFGAALAVLAGWGVLLVGAGLLVDRRRDVT